MRLKLVNAPHGAQNFPGRIAVVNAETGEEVKWVSSVTLTCDVGTEFRPIATIRVDVDVDLDVTAFFEAVTTKVLT